MFLEYFKIFSGSVLTVTLFLLTRWIVLREKREKLRLEAAAVLKKEKDDVAALVKTEKEAVDATLNGLKVQSAENITQHTNFQVEFEKMRKSLHELEIQCNASTDRSRTNELKIDNVRDSIARIEAQIGTLLHTLLDRR